MRHPARHLGPVKLGLQLTHGVVVKHPASSLLVEPQRGTKTPERAAQVTRQRRRRRRVPSARRGHQADGHHIRPGPRALQRGVELTRHRLEQPRRGDGVPGAHERQRAAGHAHQLAVAETHRGRRVPATREQRGFADGLAAASFLVLSAAAAAAEGTLAVTHALLLLVLK